jgi:hypothetical protein
MNPVTKYQISNYQIPLPNYGIHNNINDCYDMYIYISNLPMITKIVSEYINETLRENKILYRNTILTNVRSVQNEFVNLFKIFFYDNNPREIISWIISDYCLNKIVSDIYNDFLDHYSEFGTYTFGNKKNKRNKRKQRRSRN